MFTTEILYHIILAATHLIIKYFKAKKRPKFSSKKSLISYTFNLNKAIYNVPTANYNFNNTPVETMNEIEDYSLEAVAKIGISNEFQTALEDYKLNSLNI